MLKRPDARLLVISTAASSLDSPLGRLRTRALAGESVRRGAHIDASNVGLRLLEWSVPEDRELTVAEVRKANPAPWVSTAALREQEARCTPLAWAQFHANRWSVVKGAWLPVGAWRACQDTYVVEDGSEVVLGVDIGGSRAASAVVAVSLQETGLRVAAVEVFDGNDSVLEAHRGRPAAGPAVHGHRRLLRPAALAR